MRVTVGNLEWAYQMVHLYSKLLSNDETGGAGKKWKWVVM